MRLTPSTRIISRIQTIVRDDADRRRLIGRLEQTVVRRGWELLRYVMMGNTAHTEGHVTLGGCKVELQKALCCRSRFPA